MKRSRIILLAICATLAGVLAVGGLWALVTYLGNVGRDATSAIIRKPGPGDRLRLPREAWDRPSTGALATTPTSTMTNF